MPDRRRLVLEFAVPILDHGTDLVISTSDLGTQPVLLFCNELGDCMLYNWRRRRYEPLEELDPWQI